MPKVLKAERVMEESLEINVLVEAVAMMAQCLVTYGVSNLEVMF